VGKRFRGAFREPRRRPARADFMPALDIAVTLDQVRTSGVSRTSRHFDTTSGPRHLPYITPQAGRPCPMARPPRGVRPRHPTPESKTASNGLRNDRDERDKRNPPSIFVWKPARIFASPRTRYSPLGP